MVISLNTVRANVFSEVYNILNSKVTDPNSRGKQWIFTSVPDVNAANFVGFPILIIGKVKLGKEFEVFDNSYSDKKVPVIITVYSTDNAVLDTLSDSVDAIMTPANLTQFKFYDYNESDGNADFGSGNVYFRTMTHSVELEGL